MQHSFQDVGYGGPNRLCFPDVFHFSKKIGFLAARLVARNFTRALGYAKRPLSPVPDIAVGWYRVRPASQLQDLAVVKLPDWRLFTPKIICGISVHPYITIHSHWEWFEYSTAWLCEIECSKSWFGGQNLEKSVFWCANPQKWLFSKNFSRFCFLTLNDTGKSLLTLDLKVGPFYPYP